MTPMDVQEARMGKAGLGSQLGGSDGKGRRSKRALEEGGPSFYTRHRPFFPSARVAPSRTRSREGADDSIAPCPRLSPRSLPTPRAQRWMGQCVARTSISEGLGREGAPARDLCGRQARPSSKQRPVLPSMTSLVPPAAGIPPGDGKRFGEPGCRSLVRLRGSISQALASGSRMLAVQWQARGLRGQSSSCGFEARKRFAELHVG